MPKKQFKKLLAILILGFLLLIIAFLSNQYQNKAKTPNQEDAKIILSQKPVLISLIRTTPTGEAMFAGIAPLLSRIELYDGEQLIGTTSSDKKGQWVMLTEKPLTPGQHQFRTYSYTKQKDEAKEMRNAGQLLSIYIPPLQFKNYPPLNDASSHESNTLYTHNGLTIDFIGYDLDDKLTIKGETKPGTFVEVILEGKKLTILPSSEQDKPGSWQVTASKKLKAGTYKILIKQYEKNKKDKQNKKKKGKKGKLLSKTHLIFHAPSDENKKSQNRFIIVKAGNSLWDIAERSYGLGNDFEKIFEANQENLASPERIYPGQILYIPRDKE